MSSTPGRVAAVLLALACLVLAPVAVGAAPAPWPVAQTEQVDPDATVMDVTLAEDGDARWRVSYRILLDDGNATDAFRSLQADVRNDSEAFAASFERRMTRTVATAENATGRSMALQNLSVTTANESLPRPTGVVTYRFEWTNFAVAEGDTIRAGDAVDQLFLDADSSLSVEGPAGYRLDSVTPAAASTGNRQVTWEGRLSFDPGEPRVVLVRGTPTPTGATASGGGFPLVPIIAVIGLFLVGGAYLVARRNGWFGGGSPDEDAGDGGPDAPPAATAGGPERATEPTDEPPEDLLSNEERVLRLVRDNGGRMKQKQVAEDLGWTAAKTSQVVGDLRDDDELEAFRLGRENVLVLPEADGLGEDLGAE